jgi:hypothetical protein
MTRKSSEPACRVCGCTEHNACDEGCSWVRTEPGSPPLCSACSGKPLDVAETCRRVRSNFRKFGFCTDTARQANAIIAALSVRVEARVNAEAKNPDASWGGR